MTRSIDRLLAARLSNQRLTRSTPGDARDVVSWLCAVQAQDYAGAKWALGLRSAALTDRIVDDAFDRGDILRTHVMRPTWHFVAPADIRWMLALTAPRVNAAMAYYYRQQELDEKLLARSRATLERVLRDGKQKTRVELATALGRAGIRAAGLRLGLLMMRAELEAVICSGARRGKQFTYALLEERAPRVRNLTREESLAELTRRYFSSHGPATLRDFVWWSGLTVRDAKRGIEILGRSLSEETIAALAHWFVPSRKGITRPSTHLLPNYDEFLIAYKDRDHLRGKTRASGGDRATDVFSHHLVIEGRLSGSWKRTLSRNAVLIDVTPYDRLTSAAARDVSAAADRYGAFLGVTAQLRHVF